MADNDVKEMLAAAKAVRKFINSGGVDDLTNCIWYERSEVIYWNVEWDMDDLFESYGETYSVVVGYNRKETESYIVYEQCYCPSEGHRAIVLSKSLEQNEDAYWENREDEE